MRYFEFVGVDPARPAQHSEKFWEINIQGNSIVTRFGKIGKTGQTTVKTLGSAVEADATAGKLIAEKVRKGYKETQAADEPSHAGDIVLTETPKGSSTSASLNKFCTSCGAKRPADGSKNCGNCGATFLSGAINETDPYADRVNVILAGHKVSNRVLLQTLIDTMADDSLFSDYFPEGELNFSSCVLVRFRDGWQITVFPRWDQISIANILQLTTKLPAALNHEEWKWDDSVAGFNGKNLHAIHEIVESLIPQHGEPTFVAPWEAVFCDAEMYLEDYEDREMQPEYNFLKAVAGGAGDRKFILGLAVETPFSHVPPDSSYSRLTKMLKVLESDGWIDAFAVEDRAYPDYVRSEKNLPANAPVFYLYTADWSFFSPDGGFDGFTLYSNGCFNETDELAHLKVRASQFGFTISKVRENEYVFNQASLG